MKKYLAFIFTVALCSCGAAPDFGHRIRIENNADKAVLYCISKNYPDTVLPIQQPIAKIEKQDWIPYDFPEKPEHYIAKLPGQRMSFFFVDPDSIDKYGWDTVRARYLLLGRKDVSASYIQTHGYVVSFP